MNVIPLHCEESHIPGPSVAVSSGHGVHVLLPLRYWFTGQGSQGGSPLSDFMCHLVHMSACKQGTLHCNQSVM